MLLCSLNVCIIHTYVLVVRNALVYGSKVQLNNLTEEAGLDSTVVTVIVCSGNIPKDKNHECKLYNHEVLYE